MSRPDDPRERALLYLDDALSLEERAAFERDVLENDTLAEAYYSEVNLAEAVREAKPASRVISLESRRPASAWWKIALPLAASMALLVIIPTTIRNRSEPATFRGAHEPLALQQPVGAVAEFPQEFVWTPAPDASSYAIEVTDETARVLVREITQEARFVLPEDLVTAGRSGGFWRVTALDANGFEIGTSAPGKFTIEAR